MGAGSGTGWIFATALWLAGELAQKLLLIHVILEGFSTVDEDDWNFVIKLPAQFVITINVNFLPGESASARKLAEAFLHQFTKMASLSRVNHHLAGFWHGWIVAPRPLPLARKKRRDSTEVSTVFKSKIRE
jgi:hypothetical protein